MWWDGEGFGGFDGPGGAVFDALGVVGELVIDELHEAVGFAGSGEDGDLFVEDLHARGPIPLDEAAFVGWRGGEAEDGGAVGGGAGGDGERGAVGEDDLGEVDDGDVVGGEVAVDAGADAAGVVGAQLGDGAGEDGFRGEDEGVVDVDGVDELGADGLAGAHGEVVCRSGRGEVCRWGV